MTLSTSLNRRLPLLAVLFASLGLVWTLQHHLLSPMLGDPALRGENPQIVREASNGLTPVERRPELRTSDLHEISQWHLFGTFEPLKTPVEKPLEITIVEPDFSNLPETRIPLKLSGIAFSPDKNSAFAMIITPDGRQADYQAGEPIGTEASVHIIEERRVVIERDGKFEALSLPEAGRNLPKTDRTVRARPNRQPRRPIQNQQQLKLKNEQNRSNPEA